MPFMPAHGLAPAQPVANGSSALAHYRILGPFAFKARSEIGLVQLFRLAPARCLAGIARLQPSCGLRSLQARVVSGTTLPGFLIPHIISSGEAAPSHAGRLQSRLGKTQLCRRFWLPGSKPILDDRTLGGYISIVPIQIGFTTVSWISAAG